MFTEIILFLLDTVFTLFGMALLLRLWMQLTRLPSRNPVSQGVFQVTDWLVRPLRRIIPGIGGIDWATVLAAYLTAVAFLVCRALVLEADPIAFLPVILGIALLTMLKWGISMVMYYSVLADICGSEEGHEEWQGHILVLFSDHLCHDGPAIPECHGKDTSL